MLQIHTHQFLGTFGGPGNGDYRGELQRAIQVIRNYATQLGLSPASILVRLDGLYGDAAPLLDVLSAGEFLLLPLVPAHTDPTFGGARANRS